MNFKLLAVGLMLLGGCGSEVETSGGGGAGGGGGEGGTLEACTGFDDAEPGSPITLRFVNETLLDVYLEASCNQLAFDIQPAAGADGAYYGYVGGACQQSCQELQTQNQVQCGACAPSTQHIPPQSSIEVTWDGRAQRQVEMAAECYFDELTSAQDCAQIFRAPAGEYSLTIAAYNACDGQGAPCECDATGLCSGTASGMAAFGQPTSFTLPTNTVEYVLDVCAFGCAEPN